MASLPESSGCTILNIQEAHKFTLGQKIMVFISHTVSAVLEVKGEHWLSPQRFLKYQVILVEQDDVEIVVTNIINLASFLSGTSGEPVTHDCLETIEAVYSSRPDLKEEPLEERPQGGISLVACSCTPWHRPRMLFPCGRLFCRLWVSQIQTSIPLV